MHKLSICSSSQPLARLLSAVALVALPAVASAAVTSTGNVTPDPTTTTLSTSLSVGRTADGTLTVDGGSTISSSTAFIGRGFTGVVTITGAGSIWNPSVTDDPPTTLDVAYSTTGTLNVYNGGRANAYTANIGLNAGSTGTVNVSGAGSMFHVEDGTSVGYAAKGTMNVSAGATADTNFTYIGRSSGSDGTVTIDGAGTTWTNFDGVGVGWSGKGSLSVTNGASANIGSNVPVGANDPSAIGTVTVSGKDTSFTAAELDVGYAGTGTATFSGGATATLAYLYGGVSNGSSSTITITDSGTSVAVSDELHIGEASTATLNISAGAVLTSGRSYVGVNGNDASTHGTVNVDGKDSSWTTADLYVGNFGKGDLNITNGGAVNSNRTYIGSYGGTGTAIVGGAGSTWTMNGTLDIGYQSTASLTINTGGTVRVNGDINLSGYATGNGSVNIAGGTLDLTGHSIIQGPGAPATFSFTGGLLKNVSSLGLSLNQTGGTLAAGNSPGAMTIVGTYTLGAAGTVEIELAGATTPGVDFDTYAVTGAATLGGNLSILTLGGYTPAAGTTFNVLTASSINTAGLTVLNPNFSYAVISGGNGQILQLTAVPEPTMVLLGAALPMMMRRRRK